MDLCQVHLNVLLILIQRLIQLLLQCSVTSPGPQTTSRKVWKEIVLYLVVIIIWFVVFMTFQNNLEKNRIKWRKAYCCRKGWFSKHGHQNGVTHPLDKICNLELVSLVFCQSEQKNHVDISCSLFPRSRHRRNKILLKPNNIVFILISLKHFNRWTVTAESLHSDFEHYCAIQERPIHHA